MIVDNPGCLLASNKSIDEKYPKLVQAVFCAHPGFFSVPHDIHNIATEFEFLFAEKDFEISSKQMQKVRELVAAMPKKIDLHYYPNTAHGFAVRGNEKDPIVKAARDDAFRKASAFLKRFVV